MKRCQNRIFRPSHTSIGFVLNFCKLLWFHLGLAPATEMGRFQHNSTTGAMKNVTIEMDLLACWSDHAECQRSTKLSDGWGTVSSFSVASTINSPTFSRRGRRTRVWNANFLGVYVYNRHELVEFRPCVMSREFDPKHNRIQSLKTLNDFFPHTHNKCHVSGTWKFSRLNSSLGWFCLFPPCENFDLGLYVK